MYTPSIAVDTLCKSLVESPTDWVFNKHVARNIETGFEIWIGNGLVAVSICSPFELSFGIIQKYRIWTAIRYAKEKQLILKFSLS